MLSNKRIVITPGEPSGIGPDLVVMLAQKDWPIEVVVCAEPSVLLDRAHQINLPLTLWGYQRKHPPRPQASGTLTILPVTINHPVKSGKLNSKNSSYVIKTLTIACDGCLSGEFSALVTGPVNKGVINDAGVPFTGHTEFFAKRSHCNQVVMMLATEKLRVALATTHLPLISVPGAITQKSLIDVIRTLDQDLKIKFGLPEPHIYVCGLNPHAGESGHIGREEIDIILPALESLRNERIRLTGPLPADTVFQFKHLKHADAVLAMYHDQGLPVLKYQGFGQAVNITLGLPFIRTSVDHGTALDLAGTGNANAGSLRMALDLAIKMLINCNAQ